MPRPPRKQAPTTHETLEGEVVRLIFPPNADGFAVAAVETQDGRATVAGQLGAIDPGQSIRVHGRWQEHRRFGRQFRAEWLERIAPTTTAGMQRYLASGAFPGIGPDSAKRLVAHFGIGVLDALEAGVREVQKVPGIGPKRARSLADAYRGDRETHRVLAELRGFGLSDRQARLLYERRGAAAVQRVQDDPYLLAREVRGIGFHTADKLARGMGIDLDSPLRARAAAVHALYEASRVAGHTCLEESALLEACAELQIDEQPAREALPSLLEAGTACRQQIARPGEEPRWYLPDLYRAEIELASDLKRLLGRPGGPLTEPEHAVGALKRAEIVPDSGQLDALRMALEEPFAVITGGPGTGKTTIVGLLLDTLETAGVGEILLASPTGRAAKRLHEATGREASTVHRLLKFDPKTGDFQAGPELPLEASFLIVDEVSMLDLPLARSLLAAVAGDTRVLLVGDADQLPPVGPGAVLRDLLASGRVPSVRLRRIHRQGADSGIVDAAHAVLAGERPTVDDASDDFFLLQTTDAERAAAAIERTVCERIPERYGLDPHRDVLVLSPIYRGPLGVDAINERLGARLNPSGSERAWSRGLRVGDRVMVVRNDYERELFNGDTGTIVAADDKEQELVTEIDGRQHRWGFEQLDSLVCAWCVTVHRAQGSEAQAVVVVLDTSHYIMLRRTLLYTALTRARRLCVLVAAPAALARAVGNAAEVERKGLLVERLR